MAPFSTKSHGPRHFNHPADNYDEKEVHVLTSDEFTELWVDYQRKKKGRTDEEIAERYEAVTGLAFNAAPTAVPLAKDAVRLTQLARDLRRGGSMFTTYRVIRRNGRVQIAFRGNHRLRKLVRGTFYNANNAQVIRMAIGSTGRNAAAKTGIILTIIVSPVIRTIEWLFDSETTWSHLLANISADYIKAIVAAGAYLAAGAASVFFLGASIPVVVPIAVGIAAAFVTVIGLDALDNALEISDKLAEAIEAFAHGAAGLVHNTRTRIKDTTMEIYEFLDGVEPAGSFSGASGKRGAMSNPARFRGGF